MRTRLDFRSALAFAPAFGCLSLLLSAAALAQERPAQPAGVSSTDASVARPGEAGARLSQEAPAVVTETAAPPQAQAPESPVETAQPAALGSSETRVSAGASEGEAGAPEVPGSMLERPATQAGVEQAAGKITFNFNNASLDSVVNVIVQAAGLKFVKTAPLAGTVTIANLDPVTIDEAIDIVDTILHTQNSAFVRQGDLLTVAPLESAKTLATPVYQGTAALGDGSLPKGAKIITWVQPLKNADATKVAKDLANLVPKYGSLTANQASNALIITDAADNVQRFLRIVRQLDVSQMAVSSIKVFHLENAVATQIAVPLTNLFARPLTPEERMARINMMMSGRPEAASMDTGPRVQIQIAADDRTNSLIVVAQEEEMKLIGEVITELDAVPRGTLYDVKIFTLEYADCNDVAMVIRQIFIDPSPAQTAASRQRDEMERIRYSRGMGPTSDATGSALREAVKVAANPGTNSVVVAATAENLELIGKMVSEIDTVAAGSPQTVGIFHLSNADCQELTNVLRQVMGLQAQGTTSGAGRTTTTNRGAQSTRGGGAVTRPAGTTGTGTTTRPTTTPSRTTPTRQNTGGRSSRLTAPAEILLWPPSRFAQSGSASDAAAPRGEVRPGVGMEVRRVAGLAQQPEEEDENASEPTAIRRKPIARNAQIVITSDERTGTVIVSAPEEAMSVIRAMVEELDRDPAEKYISQVYHLNNADATNLSSVMNSIFSGVAPGGEGIAAELRGTVSVVPDTSSNSLIITSAPRNFDRIYQLVKDLDQAPPQVMIQVVLVEVTLNKGSKIGIQDVRFDFHKVLPQPVEFAVGDTTLFWSVIDQKVSGFLDLLQTEGSVEVLSRPQVLASDNKPAEINVGQSVPFVTRTQTTESGSSINTIEYQDIGIILDVTPHINPEGYVNMEISPQILGFADSTVNVGNNVTAPVFTKRSATTTVAVQDGQTIVIGGLMTNEEHKTVREMPVLSKIPLLGPLLFRHTETSKVKTDLLVIITPKVVRSPEEAARMSAEERARSSVSSEQKTEEQIQSLHLDAERFGFVRPAAPKGAAGRP